MDEVNEIKSLYDKAQQEMRQNFENEELDYKEKLEQKVLEQQTKNQKDEGEDRVGFTKKLSIQGHFD